MEKNQKSKTFVKNNQDQHLVTFKSFREMKSCKLVTSHNQWGNCQQGQPLDKEFKKFDKSGFNAFRCNIFTIPWEYNSDSIEHLSLIIDSGHKSEATCFGVLILSSFHPFNPWIDIYYI